MLNVDMIEDTNYAIAAEILDNAFKGDIPEGLVGLNIGTSEKGKLRRWPARSHALLAEQVAERYPQKGIVILSGPEDTDVRERVMSNLSGAYENIKVLPNDIEIGNFIALVSNLNLVITSDTFGMHVALSQGIPTLALQGPMPPHELELKERDGLIGPKLDCNPCFHRCSQEIKGLCMELISVDEVANEVDRLINLSNVPDSDQPIF